MVKYLCDQICKLRTVTHLSGSKNADFYVSFNSICHYHPFYLGLPLKLHYSLNSVCSVITPIFPSGDCRWNKRCCMLPPELQWRKSLVAVMWSMRCSVQLRSAWLKITIHNYDRFSTLLWWRITHRASYLVCNTRRTSVCWATSVMCHPAQVQPRSH